MPCIIIITKHHFLGVNVFGLWKHNFWWNILHTEWKLWWKKFPNFWQNLSAFVRGWQLVAVGVTWPFWIMWHQLVGDSWGVQAGVPVQSRPPSVGSDGLLYSPGHMVFLVQCLGLFQAALVARIVQMFTHRCSRVSACHDHAENSGPFPPYFHSVCRMFHQKLNTILTISVS